MRDGQQLDYTLADLRELVEPYLGLPCPFCQALLTPGNFSIDHADPASRRGSFSRDNLIVCCLRCNQTKGPLTEEEFCCLIDLLNRFQPEARQSVLKRLYAGGRLVRG